MRTKRLGILIIATGLLASVGTIAICQNKPSDASRQLKRESFSGSSPLLILDNGLNPSAVLIGNKEIICMATDWTEHYPLIAQRVDGTGRLLWKTVQISNPQNSLDQDGAGIILPRPDGGAYFIFEYWEFKGRSGDAVLYAGYPHIQLIDASGKALWGVDGKRMTNMIVGYEGGARVLLTHYASDGSVIAYWDWFGEDSIHQRSSGVYVQKIDAATGLLQWGEAGRLLFDRSPVFTISNRFGTTFIGHGDSVACFNSEGQVRWDYPLWRGIPGQEVYTTATNDDNELLILYTSDEGIKGRLFGADGQPLWTEKLIAPNVNRIPPGTKLINWGRSRWVFKMGAVGTSVFCVDRTGTLYWGGISATGGILAVSPVDSENVFVAYKTPREGENFTYDLLVQKLNAKGEPVWQTGGIKIIETVSTNCLILPDSAGGAILIVDALAQYEPNFRQRGTYMQCVDKDGNLGIVTSVRDQGSLKSLPAKFSIICYPNPFNPSTTIRYELPRSSAVSLEIFNTLGQKVALLVNEPKDAGSYQVRWNASNVPSGIYFYRLQAEEYVETKKMVLIR